MKLFLRYSILASILFLFNTPFAIGETASMSEDTETCIDCHSYIHPGIVADWKRSKHAKITSAGALKKPEQERRISGENIPDKLLNSSVGCAECHTINANIHRDSFEHNDFQVHPVVTPGDCSKCHPVEVRQYGNNIMSHAYANLKKNEVYRSLVDSVNGIKSFDKMKLISKSPDAETDADSCLFCHGTVIQVKGMKTRETVEGEMSFPVLSGWPNQGVGRINPDNTKGSCASCHTRHRFSIEMARKPETCAECHKGPDVPAYKVYMTSKHGNIYSSMKGGWDFDEVPWVPGRDFAAPTCAACHVSLLVSEDGDVVAERSHQMNNRLAWRIFGLIYAHAHPSSPDTTIIRNRAGLPLPTELSGEPAYKYLIDKDEQTKRTKSMQKICNACHSMDWIEGQFARFENSIKTTNEMTLTATKILQSAWDQGAAKGLAQKDSIFNEAIEKMWIEQWLFYANSTRFASAMMGADFGAFANGRWYMSKNIQDMIDWLEFKLTAEQIMDKVER